VPASRPIGCQEKESLFMGHSSSIHPLKQTPLQLQLKKHVQIQLRLNTVHSLHIFFLTIFKILKALAYLPGGEVE
jgi:hypothetical protein